MPDPVLIAIAAALTGKAAGAIAARGASALRSMAELVRQHFDSESEVLDALEPADADAEQERRTATLGAALERASVEDPQFAESLRTMWEHARTELHADHGGVVNEVSGSVGGHVVQARDVTGGVSFGDVPRREN